MQSNRVAITDIDFDKINISHIYKILESIIGNRIQSVGLYQDSKNGSNYAIAIFKDTNSACQAYELCDGVEIEQSGVFLSLSFVPEDMQLDELIELCENSKNFIFNNEINKKMVISEDMVELADDGACYFEIPEEIKSKIRDEESRKEKEEEKGSDKKSKATETEIKSLLDEEERTNEFEDFKFNLEDERFSELFKNNDFALDASNKKFKGQKASNLIHGKTLEDGEKQT